MCIDKVRHFCMLVWTKSYTPFFNLVRNLGKKQMLERPRSCTINVKKGGAGCCFRNKLTGANHGRCKISSMHRIGSSFRASGDPAKHRGTKNHGNDGINLGWCGSPAIPPITNHPRRWTVLFKHKMQAGGPLSVIPGVDVAIACGARKEAFCCMEAEILSE